MFKQQDPYLQENNMNLGKIFKISFRLIQGYRVCQEMADYNKLKVLKEKTMLYLLMI